MLVALAVACLLVSAAWVVVWWNLVCGPQEPAIQSAPKSHGLMGQLPREQAVEPAAPAVGRSNNIIELSARRSRRGGVLRPRPLSA